MRLVRSSVFAALFALVFSGPNYAQSAVDPLLDALEIDRLIAVMREEGLSYGEDLRRDMFPGSGQNRWTALVGEIYAQERMAGLVVETLQSELGQINVEPLVAFFSSDVGQRIINLEIDARRALLDPDIETATREQWAREADENSDRLDALRRFVTVNDLVESNVVGALNASFAFYNGLADGGAPGFNLTDEEMLRDVWQQEAEIRDETEIWVFSYLNLAYQPLSVTDLNAYIAVSETPEGAALNRALFAAFDKLFVGISRDLGFAASQFVAGEDI
ncbi:MAG: DUF2059 domain-containing protein [Pseudomonadota bacterium]